jgi:GalNAc-alpha-(1->4)-GalNAc-alpha-(1->3)-diNAcBac-PP-undecaprenol alpha-1,4-N-acetyl-D-galactosaminyltransferase
MKKVDLLIVTSTLGSGGAERVISILATEMNKLGISTCILTTHRKSHSDYYTLPKQVLRIRLWDYASQVPLVTPNWMIKLFGMRYYTKMLKPSTVLSFIGQINLLTLLSLVGMDIPIVVSERNDPSQQKLNFPWRLLRRVLYKRAYKVHAQTDRVAKYMETEWKLRMVNVIPNPLTKIPTIEKSIITRDKTILAVGRLAPQKNFDILLNIWQRLSIQFPDWKLRIIGEGPERVFLEKLIMELNIKNSVELCGLSKNIWSEYSRSRLFVLTSKYEGFPNALLEAMASGCSCISFDCPSGPSELIKDGINGILVENRNTDLFASSVTRVIESEEFQIETSARAMSVREKYEKSRITKEWIDLLGL